MHDIDSKEQFAMELASISRINNINIIDAITEYCERHTLDIDDIIQLLDKNLKEQIRVTAIKERYVTGMKLNQLPI